MLDINFIREHKDLVKEGARKKHIPFDIDALIAADDKRRTLLFEVEGMKAEQNEASKRMQMAPAAERGAIIGEMKTLKEKLRAKEMRLRKVMDDWMALMIQVPNIPDMSVPEGASDAENREIRKVGEIPKVHDTFKGHIPLMESLGMADFERGTKLAGFRGYVLRGDGALLSFALWRFALDRLLAKGFTPFLAPSLVRRENFVGTGYIPQGEEDLYKTQDGDYLAGTAEVGVMGYYMDEILEREELPKRFIAFSPCFRREAGSHGKDTKGLVRVHEFYKMEQVVLCEADHEISVRFHEELTHNAEELLTEMGLPYRVVINCAGDLGLGQVKKYDIEVWMPSEEKYRETHSSSYFHDFQARRLNIRYRTAEGKTRFVHSLNNTAIATPRLLAALVELCQQEDGSIKIPEALVPYMGKEFIKAP